MIARVTYTLPDGTKQSVLYVNPNKLTAALLDALKGKPPVN